MTWSRRFRVSSSLNLGISPGGRLFATNSLSRPPYELSLDVLPVLMAFADEITPRDAFDRLSADYELEESGFRQSVGALIAQNLLTSAESEPAALAPTLYASPLPHHHMLGDSARDGAYRAAIERYCPGRRVVEIGCGTGILSLFAARAGALHVDAIEESAIADMAEKLIAANGYEDRITLHRGNSRDISLPEPGEVLIHELLGTDPFGEGLLRFVADARERLLTPDARFLPARLEVACVGIDSVASGIPDADSILAEAKVYVDRFGFKMAPWIDWLGATAPRFLRGYQLGPEAAVLTNECLLYDLDFATSDLREPALAAAPTLHVTKGGKLSSLAVFFRAHFDDELVLSTSPADPATCWGFDLRPLEKARLVAAGDLVELDVRIQESFGWQQTYLALK